jgi:ribosomal-protein-alanine N-acetyltransferase
VVLVLPAPEHAPAFLAALAMSRARFEGFVDPPGDEAEFRTWCQRARSPRCCGRLVREADGAALIGVVALNDIEGGRSASLACYGFAASAGRGLVTEAARILITEASTKLGLERLRAELRAGNAASRAMIERLGFEALAEASALRRVGGAWHPHLVFEFTRGVWLEQSAEERA